MGLFKSKHVFPRLNTSERIRLFSVSYFPGGAPFMGPTVDLDKEMRFPNMQSNTLLLNFQINDTNYLIEEEGRDSDYVDEEEGPSEDENISNTDNDYLRISMVNEITKKIKKSLGLQGKNGVTSKDNAASASLAQSYSAMSELAVESTNLEAPKAYENSWSSDPGGNNRT